MGKISELRRRPKGPKPKALALYQRANDDTYLPFNSRRRLKAQARLLRRAVDIYPQYDSAWAQLTRTYSKLSKGAHACVAFRHLVALDSFLAAITAFNVASDVNNALRYEEALEWNNRAIELEPEIAIFWYHKTAILRNMACFRDEKYWKDVPVAAEQNIKVGGYFIFAFDYRDTAIRELRAQAERARAEAKVLPFRASSRTHERQHPGVPSAHTTRSATRGARRARRRVAPR